ncbi:RNA chaperone Hfq [Clostridia bacterium OttesenSCG-928-F22]|nr:RNA chaperone Hfq [Clostridia bacterium OttesenSCG-928-F22]
MPKNTIILQDVFLNLIRKDQIMLDVHLIEGTKIRGFVKGFDNFTIIIRNEDSQVLIYKNAIALLAPDRPVLM